MTGEKVLDQPVTGMMEKHQRATIELGLAQQS